MGFIKRAFLYFLVPSSFLLVPLFGFSQTVNSDSTRKVIDEFMFRLRNHYQHTGFKLRFDTGLQIPVSQEIRSNPVKLYPGFGFNLGVGYGFNENLSAFVLFTSLSHVNDNFKVIKSQDVGFDGFHGEVRYKFQPYTKDQFFVEAGGGIFELVDQKSEGFTGWSVNFSTGFDRFLTNEIVISFYIEYKLTRFGSQITGNNKIELPASIRADMLGLKTTLIYTFPSSKDIFDL